MRSIPTGAQALAVALAFFSAGCAADSGEPTRGNAEGTGTASLGASGAGGTGGGDGSGFDNSTAPQPPPVAGDLSVSGGACKAGHYVGTLGGMYRTPLLFEFPVQFETEDVPDPAGGPDIAGFEFWLTASDEAQCEAGQEFCFDFRIEGGMAQGYASGSVPFEMEMVGDLDCSQGVFVGELRSGKYTLAGIDYLFEGTISGSFDADNDQFFDGVWEVSEPASVMLGGNAGGNGEWYAGWIMD